MRRKGQEGQIILIAIVVLVIMAISLPALIGYVDRESKWTLKQQRTTRAFQLAEGAVERGFQQVISSTSNWTAIQAGTPLAGANFDQTYTDVPGGQYEIRITSGPGKEQMTIYGVGRDGSSAEVRAVVAIFGNTASNAAIYAMGGLTLTSNPDVEWGPVYSPADITTDKSHPRFYSSGNVSLDTNAGVPPNSDNVQWWDYYANLPPPPQVDLQAYFAAASAAGTVLPGGVYSLGNVAGTYYFTGDVTLKPNSFVNGNLVVMGNLTMQGNAASGAYTATLPTNAWKEYGNDWATWRSDFDSGAGAWPGASGTYSTSSALPLTYPLTKVVVHGFLYVLNSFSITGGGNCCVHGSMYLGTQSDMSGSHVKVYFDDTVTVKTKNLSLARQSWQETHCSWSATSTTCS